jgi:hypothetical protein
MTSTTVSSIQNISIYIPKVFVNITKERMENIIEKLYGKVKEIDLISKVTSNGEKYNSAYIHFDYWYDNVSNQNLQNRLLNDGKETRIVYDDPWYWIILQNKGHKKDYSVPRPKINVSGLNEIKNENKEKMFVPRVLTLKKLNIIENVNVVQEE